MPAQALSSEVREDGTVHVTVGRQDFAQAHLILTPEGRGSTQVQEIMESLYDPATVGAILISRKQERKRA